MLVVTREVYMEKLLELPRLIDGYQKGDYNFSEKAVSWLRDLERSLGRLRSPFTSVASIQRARVIKVLDGFGDPGLKVSKRSKRKEISATASLALGEVERELIRGVRDIDHKFDAWREKLAQFISVASNSEPIPMPSEKKIQREWLQKIWRKWGKIEETQGMYRYLNTVMAPGDRLYLLSELMENVVSANKSKKDKRPR